MERTNKRVILIGPSASGKTYISDNFKKKGYEPEVSCTSRPMRAGEICDVDYKFVSNSQFKHFINVGYMYEYVKYGEHYYGTLLADFYKADIFVWETEGLKQLKPKDRDSTLIIYVNTPIDVRMHRMTQRGWDMNKIAERLDIDDKLFKDFKDFDIEIQSC